MDTKDFFLHDSLIVSISKDCADSHSFAPNMAEDDSWGKPLAKENKSMVLLVKYQSRIWSAYLWRTTTPILIGEHGPVNHKKNCIYIRACWLDTDTTTYMEGNMRKFSSRTKTIQSLFSGSSIWVWPVCWGTRKIIFLPMMIFICKGQNLV